MNEVVFSRQLQLVPQKISNITVCIIGCGGLGSYIALMLLKTGVKSFVLYDFDSVEEHNIPTQFFRKKDIGKPKVDMLAEQLHEHAPDEVTVEIHNEKYTKDTFEIATVIIPAVDSMQARIDISKTLNFNMETRLILDPRMGGIKYEIYTCLIEDPTSIKNYKSSLISDDEAEELSCTAKATVFIAALIAGEITNIFRKFLEEKDLPRRIIFNGNTNNRLYLRS